MRAKMLRRADAATPLMLAIRRYAVLRYAATDDTPIDVVFALLVYVAKAAVYAPRLWRAQEVARKAVNKRYARRGTAARIDGSIAAK